ncbi:SDR family oxidoreductase [Hyphomonas sp. FCG-A18]|jgi:NAD(P)-dependent dehydrogenase (short-subunit alcohol dehydrogenase family)|uniref:SDR family NAD(P)-dependent oxidoreductase n=1 Tax=Hyphomonas sp. FCG-A18 TaxID=3080019 RepID=UPI002B2AEC2E|nr:SDR family oxidoreductase [Hyphomonas sp. FCG-A18]
MADLSGKVAVITGAASGIGLAGVEVFVEAGAKVIAADLQDDKGKALEARFGAENVAYRTCNVTDNDALKALMQSAVDTFGGLDILWNNAGSGGTPTGVEDLDLAGYDMTMDLLLKSVFAGTHFAVPHMVARGGGSVVNTSSISAVCAGYAPITYSVAKKAVAHFSKLAAAELSKHQIRVNAILPGFIATSIFGASLGLPREQADQMAEMVAQNGGAMQPIGRIGKGTDIAQMAAFLASDEAGFVTGGEFLVDGGMTVGPRHSWNESEGGPLLDALGITPEQAEAMAAVMKLD